MSALDVLVIPSQIASLALKTRTNEEQLLALWRKTTEDLVSAGLPIDRARLQAYDKVVAHAYKQLSFRKRN